ncbi:cadherin domain-containing protein [Neobacillus niacini]|uniref:cadherin domain-containing protein n=1 Tax=Neobacillus niacini TaxID=86668 RepID=UPI0021CAEF6C|nr:cadherin domain-containing protein [Neobacillus niacini]MCM3763790.1 cadherin domain-containing protein [Neobacillus niacini]
MKIVSFKGLVAFVLFLQLVIAGPISATQRSYAASGTLVEGLVHQYTSNTWANSNLFTSPSGDLYLSHVKGMNEITIKKWENNQWKELTAITAAASGDSGFNAGVSDVAIDGNNTIYAAFLFYRGSGTTSDRGVKYGIYKNGSWSFEKVESAQDPYGWKNMYDPKIAFDANGKAHIVYVYNDANEPRKYEVHYATNQSGSWVINKLVSGTSSIDEVHEPQIQIDQTNTIHITYVKEDNQNDYYGNVYYTHKKVSDQNFPVAHEKIIDSKTDKKNYYAAPFVVDSSGKIYLSYSDDAYTNYLLTNKSGTWTKEVITNDGISYPFKTSVINNKPYVIFYKDTGGPATFFAMVKDAGTWKKGTKEVSSQLMSSSPSELITEMDPSGNIMIVMEDNNLRNLTYLYGTSNDFGLNFAPPLSSNANLSSLAVSPGALVPGFSADTTDYSVSVGYDVQKITVTPTVADSTATITVNDQSVPSGVGLDVTLQTGPNLIPVKVTAQDGTVKTYTVTVQKAAPSNNANLANLTANPGVLNPIFQTLIKDYSLDVPNSTSQIRFTPTTADANATVTVGGNVVKSGQESPPISLTVGKNSIPIIVTAQDGSTVTYTVKVNRNTPPVAADLQFSVDENAANGTVVGNVGGSDPDGQALTYRILSGNAENIFKINAASGEITVANGSLLDFETTQNYSLTVEVSDGVDQTTATVTIGVNDLNDNRPVAHGFTKTIDENLANGTIVGKVTATDHDANTHFSYRITAGNEDGAFAMDPSSGEVTVANSVKLDYETIKTFSLTIQVSDGVHTAETTATIGLNNLNDNKPVAEDAVFNVDENAPNWTVVGKVIASDADGDILRYQILSGNEDGAFAINASTGEITVADSHQLDYERKTVYQLRVQALDTEAPQAYDLIKALFRSMESDIATITINVNNVNDHQPVPQGFTKNIDENSAAGTSVGFVTATDADEGSVFSYKLTAGNEAGAFAIDEVTGEVTVADSTKLDYEKVQSFTLTVEVSDGDHTAATTVTIEVNNLNDNQPVVDDAVFVINENATSGTTVGTVTGHDADGDQLHYAITAGNESGAFRINSETGTISVADAGKLDFEKVQRFALTVQTSDGLHAANAAVVINLNNVNDNAPVGEDAHFTIDENSANGTVVGTVTGHDADGDKLHYSIAAGNDLGAFTIDKDTGEVTVADSGKLDYEKVQSFTLTVEVSDGTHTAATTVAIGINNLNDNKPVGEDVHFTIEENKANGTIVGTVTGHDADGDSLHYSITAGNEAGAFAIDEDTGEVTVADSTKLDYEKVQSFTLTIEVSDGLHTANAAVVINLTNVNDNAPVSEDALFTIDENKANGTIVGTVTGHDADGDSLHYKMAAGNEAGAFAIGEDTGEVTVADSTKLDYEKVQSFKLTVQVSDGTHSAATTVTIGVNNLNDNPPVVEAAKFDIDENAVNDTAVGTVTGDDADGDQLHYAITAGNESGAFRINSETGTIRVADAEKLDYEKVKSFALTVQTSDGIHTVESAVAIHLNNVNDNQPVVEDTSFTIEETAAAGTVVGMAEAHDDDGDGLTYSVVSGNDDGIFAVNETTGEISVANSSRLSAKEKALHVLSIGVSDGKHTAVMRATVRILSSDATLSGLTSSVGSLAPAFTPGKTQYTIYVVNNVEEMTFTPTAAYPKATVKMNGKPIMSGQETEPVQLETGRNLQTIEVTSETGQTTTYNITVIRLKPVIKVIPEATDTIVTVPDEEVDLLDENGTLLFELKENRARNQVVKLTAGQIATLIKRHASIQILGKDVQMRIPAANFADMEDVTISIARVDKNSANIPFSRLAVGEIYELTIKQGDTMIHQFNHEIELSFSVNGYAHPELLKVHYFNEAKKEWELVGGTFKGGQVIAKTNHFSTFALFQPDDLVVNPAKKPATGGDLPETSTSMYNWLLAGLLIVILGGAMLRIQRVGRR